MALTQRGINIPVTGQITDGDDLVDALRALGMSTDVAIGGIENIGDLDAVTLAILEAFDGQVDVADPVMAANINTPGTATRAAIDARVADVAVTASVVQRIVVSQDPNETLSDGDLLLVIAPPLYWTDFSEYATGVAPSDWTRRWTQGVDPHPWEVVEDGAATGGKLLRDPGVVGSIGRLLSWDKPGRSAKMEIVMRWRAASTAIPPQPMLLCDGTTSQHGYPSGVQNATTQSIRVGNFGSLSTLASESGTWNNDTWYITRARRDGTLVACRTWADGDPEPGSWDLSVNDSTLDDGFAGIRIFGGAVSNVDIDWFGVSMSTDLNAHPAPTEAV